MEEKEDIYSSLTDLALEAKDMAVERTGGEISGVSLDEEEKDLATISRIGVLNEAASNKIGKPVGDYTTIESDNLRQGNRVVHEQLSGILATEINKLIDYPAKNNNPQATPTILAIGLGNRNATPDALGPEVVHHLLVTRHIYDSANNESRSGIRSVCALAPGVLGLTGIETAEIIKGVVERVKPDLILAIDALAARESERLASTIQISNTGIYPGSGIGKQRIGITKEDMGVPVIAMGMPTVINSANIVNDTIDEMRQNNNITLNIANRNQAQKQIINNILQPFMGDMIVAPKGIDKLIKDTSRVIAGGINIALHPDVETDNVSLYLQ
ncbi:MAG: GPR endopeptidase [Bacillota bacterium]